ncbi:type I-C CRISPR-associated protein Cas5c [Salinispira pacifica]|uniref:pre-crRNA processing endonuclease n=1 Tax=Salinispira pacifica TaxID=1307761 RepID=V5WDZ1_9SPIO|nr:type I-C CRISPR-associated protein Cas5c [Salinispira pacifica]AHC14003.1 CRISPR-associated protein, Cas5d family [Salinispira pacifica]
MEHYYKTFCLEVEGDYACFTRPEMKVERVSYDVITPSAARGIFEAILWKPSVSWQVKKIEVLKPIRWTSIRRNEVGAYITRTDGVYIEDVRQQRAGLILRDVAYRLYAELRFHPEKGEPRKDENPAKYNAMFERRAGKGQCFNQPYLGCREYSCRFALIDHEKGEREKQPIHEDSDLGFMLYDMQFPKPDDEDQEIRPAFYRPLMKNGVIEVPDWDSGEVYL